MQEDLIEIFKRIRNLMAKYEGALTATFNLDSRYDLSSVKDVIIAGRKKKELYFAGLIIQKGYVGFYYMPIYVEPEIKSIFKPELLKLLKGKTCFRIKKLEDVLEKQIEEVLEKGYELYKERGWV